MDVTLGLALLAGFVSFISPCVLPLVPAYIGYMSGRVMRTVSQQVGADGVAVAQSPTWMMRFNTLLHGMAFVLGFTVVFVSFGLLITVLAGTLNVNLVSAIMGRLGGMLIIFFGLHFMGVMPSLFGWMRTRQSPVFYAGAVLILALSMVAALLWGFSGQLDVWNSWLWENNEWAPILGIIAALTALLWLFLSNAFTAPRQFVHQLIDGINAMLYADTRQEMRVQGDGLPSSFLMGMIFSAGWTPCIGPVYGTILTVAAQTGDAGYALPLLAAYSLGLGVPFLLSSLLLDGAQGVLRRLQRHMRLITLISGVFLVLIGFLVMTGTLQQFSLDLSVRFADLSIRVEECAIGWAQGELPAGIFDCLSNGIEA